MVGEIGALLIGYVCGSIPFGLLLSRAAGLGDIRKIGSGNIGATNVLRTGNKSIAALTLLADFSKGLLPVLGARWLAGDWAMFLAGFAAIAGHIFPVWLGFKGGKGVATTAGVLFAWYWPLGLISLGCWTAMFAWKRISSLAALSAAVSAVLATTWIDPSLLWAVILLAIVVFITHRANIARLLKGEETPSSFSKPA